MGSSGTDDMPHPCPARFRGGCLCGAVRYEVRGPLRDVVACHCGQCRRQTGHYLAASAARRRDFRLIEQQGLAWYRSSPRARRGFCARCGSTLFWESSPQILVIAAGSLDAAPGLRLVAHIYVADKGDYYSLDDDLPKHPRGGPRVTVPDA